MKKGESGFTIIEVALAIAIAGLIFLMAFVALPWFRASQRDTKRREDLIHFIDEVKNYQQKNRGTLPGFSDNSDSGTNVITVIPTEIKDTDLPSSWNGFYRDYLKENFTDPDGEQYKLEVHACTIGVAGEPCLENSDAFYPNDYKIIVVTSAVCINDRPAQSDNHRRLATMYYLQNGGVACVNS